MALMRIGVPILLVLAGSVAVGCGASGPAAPDASGGDGHATGGDVRDGGTTVVDASSDVPVDASGDTRDAGRDLGREGPSATACPATPPLSGSTCTGTDCYYEDCGGRGRTIALCHPEGTFDVQTTACTEPACIGTVRMTCVVGDICKNASCAPNPCGKGPISCACACAGACTIAGGTGGVTVTCAPGEDAGDAAAAADAGDADAPPSVSQNPPVPAGWGLIPQPEITPDMIDWSVMILDDPTTYPMFSTAMRTFGVVTVLARVEWHPPDAQNAVVHRGVTLYEPL
jgi:hypothetical protein